MITSDQFKVIKRLHSDIIEINEEGALCSPTHISVENLGLRRYSEYKIFNYEQAKLYIQELSYLLRGLCNEKIDVES